MTRVRECDWNDHHFTFDWPENDHGLWEGPLQNWTHSHYEKIQKYCKKFDIVIQAGGAAGMYPKFLSTFFKTVYTFEPEYINFACLARNCPEQHIVKINGALSSGHHMVHVERGPDNNVGCHRMKTDEAGHVPCFRMDDLILTSCDLIMLDLEGFEPHAMPGAERLLKEFKPVIFAENGGSLGNYLEQFGYKYVESSYADAIFVV